MNLVERVSLTLSLTGKRWKLDDDELLFPSEDDIETVLENTKAVLDRQPGEAQIEVGGLIVKKSDGHYDIYVHVGEIDGNWKV